MTYFWICSRLLWDRRVLAAILFLTAGAARAQDLTNAPATEGGPELRLSLKQAVEIALGPEGNTRVQIAQEMIRQAKARATQARAALLPNVDASVGQQSLTRNLEAFGFRVQSPIQGFSIPKFVGPFNVFDARATASQSVLDWGSIRRYQSARTGIQVAEGERDGADDLTRTQVARAYVSVLRAAAALDAVRSNVALAEALLKLAGDQKTEGTGTGIEVTRARVQLANERQRLLVAQDERKRAQLQLLRAIGLNLDVEVQLEERLGRPPVDTPAIEGALQVALQSRADWKSQEKRMEAARLNLSAARAERLPSLSLFGDYGTIGTSIDQTLPTRTVGFNVRIPVFDGGRRDGRRAEAGSLAQQEQLRTRDLRAQIEMEIRLALDSLRSAREQVEVSGEGVSLANDEVARAKRRYEAGMSTSIEITDAQNRLERAQDNRIAALYQYNLARIDLGSAMGTIRQMIQ